MKRFYFLLMVILLISISLYAFAQSPHFRKHLLPHEHSKADVTCILQDRNHFLWLGTSGGLVRFDGISYKDFAQPDSSSHVTALFEDVSGFLWVGFHDGKVSKLLNGKVVPIAGLDKFPTSPVTGITQDINGSIWISTYGEGMVVLSNGLAGSFDQKDGLSDNFVYAILADKKGNILSGTDRGISICNLVNGKKTVNIITTENGLSDNIVTSLLLDKNDQLWIGTESKGVCSLDLESRQWNYPSDNWSYGRVTSILALETTIWAGTSMHGIIESDRGGRFSRRIGKDDKTLPLRVSDLEADMEGNIWIGGPGSLHSGNRTFTILNTFGNIQPANIQAILYGRDGTIWFSTSTGVYTISNIFSSQPFAILLDIPQLKGIQVISLFQDTSGFVWLGTFDYGVFRYDPTTKGILQLTEKDGLINNNVLSIDGKQNELWFATLGGISQCKIIPGNHQKPEFEFNNYTSEHGLGSNYIYKIFVDTRDRIWFATDGKGISVRENGKFRNFTLNEGAKSNIIYSVTEHSSGQIWISTSNAGVFRLEGDTFKAFSPKNRLRDLAISSIIGDKNGNILLVSKQGIDMLDPVEETVFHHGQEFGIADLDPSLNAYSIDSLGDIWLGTQIGIVKYNANIAPLPKLPITKINSVQLFLEDIDTVQKKFSYKQNHISFDYMGFWYHDPAEVTYRLKLEGYDREWITSKNNFITYPNLPEGNYRFIVQSSATNHFTGVRRAEFNFTITPPFYRTAWFFILIAVALASLIFWFITIREKRLKIREKSEKDKIKFQLDTLKNQVNPHFLFNSFNTLIGVIEEDKATAVEYVEKLSDFYRNIILNREKDLIPLSKELEMLNDYYFLQLKRFKKNFNLNLTISQDKLEHLIPPLTLQLLVENALKHNIVSNERPLIVDISIEGEYLVVRNNLQRKTVYESSTGMGLSNIKGRFKLLTSKNVRLHETPEYFVVYIPLLDSRE